MKRDGFDPILFGRQNSFATQLADIAPKSGAGAPTTSTVGAVGQLYLDTTPVTGRLYVCAAATGGVYTWQPQALKSVVDELSNPPSVRAYNSANISAASGQNVILTFDSETLDTDGMHDVSTNPSRITCKRAGLYYLLAQIEFSAASTGVRSVWLQLNGSTVISRFLQLPDSSAATRINISALYRLAINDYVEVGVYQTATGSVNVNRAADYSPIFSAVKVGP